MGIAGLLPLLKDIQVETHVEQYRGKTLGIDAYVWLHRGAYACASDLALGRPTTRYVAYAAHRIRMLKHYGVRPYVVFDGGPLPSKAGTEAERAARRAENRAKGLALHQQNKGTAARDAFVRCVDVTPAMAYELIKVLRAEGIEYVVAPYEADAQLAFLEREGMIDGIITEDSDLLVFGCKTVLFKLDTYGNCVELQQARLANAKQVSFEGWGAAEFRQMAILSGCDYLPSIVGMGLKNAHKLLRRYESAEKVVQALRLEGKMSVPLGYEDAFRRAEFTFMHQRVWDPRGNGCLATLTPLPQDVHEHLLAFIGAPMAWEEARAIAKGELCPIAKTPLGGAPLAAPPLKSAQPSLRSFFGQEKRATPRKVLGELDTNVVGGTPAHGTPVRATTPARTPVASAPARTPVASAPTHPAPVPCATPAPLACAASKFFTPKADVSTDASSLFDRSASSDGVHTPQTSSQGSPCSSPPPSPKNTWKDGVSSPVSSPTHSPVAPPTHLPNTPALRPPPKRPATSPGLALQMEDDGADENDAARRSAWFKRFSFSGPRARAGPPTDPGLRTAAAPRRAVSDATPTRMQAQAPTTPRLPLASKRAATPADSVHVKRVHVDLHDTPAPASGSAKLLQFRYKEK